MIYLAVLKYNIDIFANKSVVRANTLNETIGYTLSIDVMFFDRILMGSYSSMKELAIASGFAINDLDFKKNVRVITEREEQMLPTLLQQRPYMKNLPLKPFYVHARLYERYIHLSLNQVVIEEQTPDTNAKNIVIKSKIITMGYFSDLICGNLLDVIVDSTNDCMLTDVSCKIHHSQDYNYLQQKFSMNEYDKIKNELIRVVQRLFTKEDNDITKEISIPISDFCNCSIQFTYQDIFELAVVLTIKSIASFITGAISNLDLFGLYGIEHFFVTFN